MTRNIVFKIGLLIKGEMHDVFFSLKVFHPKSSSCLSGSKIIQKCKRTRKVSESFHHIIYFDLHAIMNLRR